MVDCLGLSITCGGPQAIGAINAFISADLHYNGVDFNLLLSALEAAPATPMLHIYASICQLYSDSRRAASLGAAQISPLSTLQLNHREQLWLSVIRAWIAHDLRLSVKKLVELVTVYPTDLVAARLGIVHCLMQGDQASMLEIACCVMGADGNRNNGPALSFVSFAYLENGDLEQAERYAREALRIDPHLAWAQHNLAHVFATRDQFELGISVLAGHESDWKGLFIRTHCHWHLAIFYILTNRTHEAVIIYRDVLLAVDWWHVVNLINVLSLLMYLDLFGEDIVPLVTPQLLTRLRDQSKWGIDSLVDLMSIWTLSKFGDQTTARELANFDQSNHPEIWHAGCSAMFFLGENKRIDAGRVIRPLVEQLKKFGGSNEQRKAITDACLVTRVVSR